EMEAYFRDTKAEDDSRKTLSAFKKIYEGAYYSEEQKKVILNTANQMAAKRMRANQEYKNYLKTLIDLTKSKSNHFNYVHDVLSKLLLNKNRDANTFLSFTSDFFD